MLQQTLQKHLRMVELETNREVLEDLSRDCGAFVMSWVRGGDDLITPESD